MKNTYRVSEVPSKIARLHKYHMANSRRPGQDVPMSGRATPHIAPQVITT